MSVWPLILIGLLSTAILVGMVLWAWVRAGARADQAMSDHGNADPHWPSSANEPPDS
jgi:hypothetical protein